MQIMINLDEKDYNAILNTQEFNGRYTDRQINLMVNAIDDGTPIPDNATNGDMIKAMFPEINKYFSNVIEWRLWWNAPYRKGGKK